MKRLTRLFIFVLFPLLANAQQPALKNFSTKNGLPSNEVYYLHNDKKGFIWICTDAGLVKYNGNYFKNFNSACGLPDNTIFEVKEDKQGRIWYRSFSGKIGYILNDSVFTISANKKIEAFVKYGIISSFALDESGNLYLGKRNSDQISFLKISPPYTEANVTEIWKNINTKAGIDIVTIGPNDFVFSDARGTNLFYSLNVYTSDHELIVKDIIKFKDNTLFTRVFRNKNNIYFSANTIFKKIDLLNQTTLDKSFSSALITAVSLDSNVLLIGERYKGVTYYNYDINSVPFDQLLKGLTFTYAVKDYQNGYWFSTLESGVFYFPSQKISYVNTDSTNKDYITQLTRSNDSTLYAGLSSGRVISSTHHISGKITNKEIYTDSKKQLGPVNSIFKLDERNLIISGALGSINLDFALQKTKQVFIKQNKSVSFKTIIDYKDSILCIALKDIYVFNKTNYDNLPAGYNSADRLTAISYDSFTNQIYLGGLRGFYTFYFQKNVTEKDRILNCRIEQIKANAGILYLATNSEGLIIKNGGRYDTLNEKKGLISNICKSIAIDKNTIWVSTNKGISKIIYHSKNDFEINNYPLSSYIDAEAVNRICILKNEACFYAGSKIYSFDTKINSRLSKFYIASLKVNDLPHKIESLVELSYKQSNLLIGYEALFYNCDIINYRYKMNKGNGSWIYTSETSVNFSSLAPGEYEFLLQAKNIEGKWIEADNKIIFKIDKPFWQQPWFIIIALLFLIGLVILILRSRYNKILKKILAKNVLKMRMYELETKAVKAQMNPHFIFNALNSIQLFILNKDNDNAYKYLSKFSKLVRKLLESNTSESITLEEEIDILKRYLEIESLRFEDSFKYDFNIGKELNLSQVHIPHMLIQPFVENAIWHGLLHKKGSKNLKIDFIFLNQKCLICVIEDNGVGRGYINKAIKGHGHNKSLAIEFITQRLELLSKTKNINCGFEITDKLDKNGISAGTKVTVVIPTLNK